MPSPKVKPAPELLTRIKARRKSLRLNAGEVAMLAGFTPSVYSRLESGHRDIRYGDLEAIARALKCSVRDLVPPRRAA